MRSRPIGWPTDRTDLSLASASGGSNIMAFSEDHEVKLNVRWCMLLARTKCHSSETPKRFRAQDRSYPIPRLRHALSGACASVPSGRICQAVRAFQADGVSPIARL